MEPVFDVAPSKHNPCFVLACATGLQQSLSADGDHQKPLTSPAHCPEASGSEKERLPFRVTAAYFFSPVNTKARLGQCAGIKTGRTVLGERRPVGGAGAGPQPKVETFVCGPAGDNCAITYCGYDPWPVFIHFVLS